MSPQECNLHFQMRLSLLLCIHSVSVPKVAWDLFSDFWRTGIIMSHIRNLSTVCHTRNETNPLQAQKANTCYTLYINSIITTQSEWDMLFPTKCNVSIWWPKPPELNLFHHMHGNETWTILHIQVPENPTAGSHKFPIITSSKQFLQEYLFLKQTIKQERAIKGHRQNHDSSVKKIPLFFQLETSNQAR